MGLLLSILVFTVGVMEAIACIRHIQYGYLPEWAPRRQALAAGTSGLANLRDRWRKKPSKSADCDNKPKKRGCDISRSCDIPCSDNVCQKPINRYGQSELSTSTLHPGGNWDVSDPVSSDVGEFNLEYQEFADVLPQEANAFCKRRNSVDDNFCFRNLEEASSQIVNYDSKAGQSSSGCENIVAEEHRLSSRSQSPSPITPKTDINWPKLVPHVHISRRPSTPTTVEEDVDGGQSPYFGGEFLTEEHVKSTQRPLSIRAQTYHSDQDIAPVLLQDNVTVDEVRSVNRPLTITTHTDGLEALSNEDYEKQVNATSENQREIIKPCSNVSSHIHESGSCDDSCISKSDPDLQGNSANFPRDVSRNSASIPFSEDVTATDGALSRSDEEKAVQMCIKQKRRTSKTEFLPHNEENLTTITQKELTPEPTFASQREEPVRLKPAKTIAFEEARLENFKPEPLHVEVSSTLHEGARRSSILSASKGTEDVEVISTQDDATLSNMATVKGSITSKILSEKSSLKKKKGVKFDDNEVDAAVESPLKCTTPSEDINGICGVEPFLEMSAIVLVDKIIDEAEDKINNSRTLSIDSRKEFIENGCITKKKNEKTVNTEPIKTERSNVDINIMSIQKEETVGRNFDSTALAPSEKDQHIPRVDFVASTTVTENNTRTMPSTVVDNIQPPKSKHTKEDRGGKKHQMNDSKETKFLRENNLEKTKIFENDFQEPQKDVQSVDPLHSTNEETKSSACEEENAASSQICAEHVDKSELTTADDSASDNVGTYSTSSSEIKESSSSSNSFPQSKTTNKTKSESRKGDGHQQRSSDATPQAFWLIFSGEYTKAMSKDWHSGHFCCWQCDESLTGQRYVLRDDHPYCIKCYESVFANTCEECNRTIGIDSKDLSYKDKHWHEACFLCTKCRVSLVDKQFGSKADKIYCGNCYDAQFASRCDGCGEIFRAGTKKMEYKTRQWHEKCFCCCVCKTAIGTKSFIPREQEIYCANCYEEKFATRCVKCNKIITSGGVTYKNEPWHRECFTCTNCNTSLAGQRFTSRDEKPYCAECFGELFAKRCTSCSRPITGIGGTRFISFEDRHWHNDCFICASCKTSLVGRGFITDADDIICPDCAKQKLM